MHAFPKLEPVLEGRTSFEEPSGTLPGTGYQRTEEYVVDDKIIALLSAKDDATHSPLAVASLKRVSRDFLVIRWLRICLPVQETQVSLLIGKLRSHMPKLRPRAAINVV